jgi:hypothetical protein
MIRALADAELALRKDKRGLRPGEPDRLRAENANLRQRLEAACGEVQRTVYVVRKTAKEAIQGALLHDWWTATETAARRADGTEIYAVTLTARKLS